MSGFDAAGAVEPLDWNFRPHVDASGTIPEPTDSQVTKLMETLRLVIGEQPLERLSKMSEDEQRAVNDQLLDAVVTVCSSSPSREQIEGLPFRVQRAFFGWLFGSLLDPQLPTAGTRPSLAVVKGA